MENGLYIETSPGSWTVRVKIDGNIVPCYEMLSSFCRELRLQYPGVYRARGGKMTRQISVTVIPVNVTQWGALFIIAPGMYFS